MDRKLPRGVIELDAEQKLWRKLKCKEILGIKKGGPYIYTMHREIPSNDVPYDSFGEFAVSISKSALYVRYHGDTIFLVKRWAFKKFFESEDQAYCTIFDDTFDWFGFTDDNSQDSNTVTMVYSEDAVKITKQMKKNR